MKNKKDTDRAPRDPAAASSKEQRKTADRERVAAIRKQKEIDKKQAFEKKQDRRATLITLSKNDRKAFLKTEKLEKHQQKAKAKADRARQRETFAALTPKEKAAHRKETRHEKKLKKRARKGYIAVQIVKYVLLAAVAAGLIYLGNVAYGMFFDNSYAFQDSAQTMLTPPPKATQTPAPTATAAPVVTPTPTVDPYDMLLSQADLDFMENRVNILVLGIDESIERSNWNSFRTDTMIFMSIDFETNNVYMISLPRDSYVWIYGQDKRARINTAFSAGGGYNGHGFEYSMNTVSLLLGGVPVNHYVCFDMNVVKEVVNAIGGLDYDVDIEFTMCGRHMEKGYQHMDGQAVLDYCRERHVDSDIGRTARQRAMLMAIFAEMKNTGQIKDVPAIYSAITGNIYTDLSFEQICSLAAFAMKLDTDSIHEYALEGGFLNIDGTSLWGINQYKKRDMVYDIFGTKIKVSESDHVTYLQELAKQKRQAVDAAESAAKAAQSYIDSNSAYISSSELSEFKTRKKELLDVASVVNISDVEPTIQPIIDATNALKAWMSGTLEPAVKARKEAAAKPTATPTTKPTATPTAPPTASPTPTDTPTEDL